MPREEPGFEMDGSLDDWSQVYTFTDIAGDQPDNYDIDIQRYSMKLRDGSLFIYVEVIDPGRMLQGRDLGVDVLSQRLGCKDLHPAARMDVPGFVASHRSRADGHQARATFPHRPHGPAM